MTGRQKLVFISSIAVPHQVRFCEALQRYFDAQFWFYEWPDRTRGAWWRPELGQHCKVLSPVYFARTGPLRERYLAPTLTRELEQFNPDIVVLGGFSIPSNWLGYVWARRRKKQTIVVTERSRSRQGVLRKRSVGWRILRRLYRGIDLVMVSAEDAIPQFRDEFGFGEKVVACRYAADLDSYLLHPSRVDKPMWTFLFANRLIDIYNPLCAVEIFHRLRQKYPGSKLVMNAAGELGPACRLKVKELGITADVEFLTELTSWSELSGVYARCDILLLPATFSNGNFTILEAMASGMGVVVSDRVLGVGNLVVDGENGFRCRPTVEAFVERIECYIKDPGLFLKHEAINRRLVAPMSAAGTAPVFASAIEQARRPEC